MTNKSIINMTIIINRIRKKIKIKNRKINYKRKLLQKHKNYWMNLKRL